MRTPAPASAVVVTFREIEKVLTGAEALGNIQEAANLDPDVSPVERAAAMAAIGHVLNQLRRAEANAGAAVMTSPHYGPATRLQSLVASGELADLALEPLPTGGFEAKFDTRDWSGWASVAWSQLKHGVPHPMPRPASSSPASFPNTARIAILGDWGSGLYGAPHIANAVENDADGFALLLHLGDVYYSGTQKEVRERFLEPWPARNDALSRALNSNHEMYSGGEPYFTQTLPAFGQESSYFAFQNRHWTLVGLDLAYRDHAIDDEQVQWLARVLGEAGDRRVIVFSHHQLYSHFESQATGVWSHPGFARILESRRIFAWYWGHEHRCTIFDTPDAGFGILGRCIGHGGMPESRARTRALERAGEQRFGRGDWRRSPACVRQGRSLPAAVVLEGRNEYIATEEDKFTPHGYAVLALDGPMLTEQVLEPNGRIIYERELAS